MPSQGLVIWVSMTEKRRVKYRFKEVAKYAHIIDLDANTAWYLIRTRRFATSHRMLQSCNNFCAFMMRPLNLFRINCGEYGGSHLVRTLARRGHIFVGKTRRFYLCKICGQPSLRSCEPPDWSVPRLFHRCADFYLLSERSTPSLVSLSFAHNSCG